MLWASLLGFREITLLQSLPRSPLEGHRHCLQDLQLPWNSGSHKKSIKLLPPNSWITAINSSGFTTGSTIWAEI